MHYKQQRVIKIYFIITEFPLKNIIGILSMCFLKLCNDVSTRVTAIIFYRQGTLYRQIVLRENSKYWIRRGP